MAIHDPIPWLMDQEGVPALRARRRLRVPCEGDDRAARAEARRFARQQAADGSFSGSVMRTAGRLCLLADLAAPAADVFAAGADYLLSLLERQPGYARARDVPPGSLRQPLDLCGLFGPDDARGQSEARAYGAREMNHYREFEPLLGPKTEVREVPRNSLDRVGANSCYGWGLIPLSYTIEALCCSGLAHDPRLQPALNVLLGAQRASGGWCRNLGGHPACTLHGLRALGAHPDLQRSSYAERAARCYAERPAGDTWLRGARAFAALHALAGLRTPAADDLRCCLLDAVAALQRRNGSFGGPNAVERVAAAVSALAALEEPAAPPRGG